YPWELVGRTALAFLPALAVWWVILVPYVATLAAVTTSLLTVLGTPIDSVTTVTEGLKRFLDLTLPEGGLRLEVAARSLSVVPYLALVAASPLPWARG